MSTKRILIPALAAFLAVTAPSAFADGGEAGGPLGGDDDRVFRFDDDDDDDDRDRRRRVLVRRDDDDDDDRDRRRRVLVRRDDDDDDDRDRRRRVLVRRDDGRRNVRRVNMRFRGLDTNGDGVITRREWRGNARSFRVHDRNRDGVLSGREVWAGSSHRHRRR